MVYASFKFSSLLLVHFNEFLRLLEVLRNLSRGIVYRRITSSYLLMVFRFPYPKVGVAELDPPKDGKTFWNFDDIRPQLEAFMAATAGHSAIPNFSTQPTWMYNTNVCILAVSEIKFVGLDVSC